MSQGKRFLSSTFTQVLMTTSPCCPSPTAVIYYPISFFFFSTFPRSGRILRQGRCRGTCEGSWRMENMQKHSRAYFQKKESANCVRAHGGEKVCAIVCSREDIKEKWESMRDPAGGGKLWEDGDARGAALSNQPPSHSWISTSHIYWRYVRPHLSSDWVLRSSDGGHCPIKHTHTHTLDGLHNQSASWFFFFFFCLTNAQCTNEIMNDNWCVCTILI